MCFGFPTEDEIAAIDPKHAVLQLPELVCDKPNADGPICTGMVFRLAHSARNCACNAVNALVKRHGVRQPSLTRRIECSHDLLEQVRSRYCHFDNALYDRWFASWPAGKRASILRSVQYDEVNGQLLSPHVKREVSHDPPSRARLIQAYGNLATQAAFGPENRCFQKTLCDIFDYAGYEVFPGIRATFACGLTYPQLANWMEDARVTAVAYYECDGKNWDSTMQAEHFEAKFAAMGVCCPALEAFARQCFVGRGTFQAKNKSQLKYVLRGTVKSGHNDTTSGNSLINALIAAHVLRDAGLRGRILVMGDDLVVTVESDFDCDAVLAIHREYGIVPIGRKFYSWNDVTFISAHWIECSGRLTFVPLLGRLLSRLWWTMTPVGRRNLAGYRRSVSMGLLAGVRGLPLYEDFISHGVANVAARGPSGWEYAGFNGDGVDGGVDGVCFKYHISRDDVRDLIQFIRKAPEGPMFASHPVADRIIARDLADIHDRPASVWNE